MFTHKDIENKNIFVINGLENQIMKLQSGFLLMKNSETDVTITKFPLPKILFIIIIGHTSITSALIDKCNKYKIGFVVMKPNFRLVFNYNKAAEGNYRLRQIQYSKPKYIETIAKHILLNKIANQKELLIRTRKKDIMTLETLEYIDAKKNSIREYNTLNELMLIEAQISKIYFKTYFQEYNWKGRKPRVKFDIMNTLLDIGYTFLFNFIESICGLFGFDLYIGFYHQLWYMRKSLICDLIEPFRCIIDHSIYKGINLGIIKEVDFEIVNYTYVIKYGEKSKYTKYFYEKIIKHKSEIFQYIQSYYRAFMNDKSISEYPLFKYK